MKEFLTDEERASLQKQHRKERDKRICDRIKAVLLRDKFRTFNWGKLSSQPALEGICRMRRVS